jgi:superfamily II DNA/RNA helicase
LTKERPAVPDRETLYALYDQAVDETNATRDNPLTTEFYLKIKDAVFEACYAALCDHHSNTRRMLTVAAPPGAGKTTFSLAFIVALTRYAEEHPEGAYGAVFLTDRDERADEIYRELDVLLPGDKVAVWTGSHSHLFKREALRQFPVAVVNNQFYFDKKRQVR